MTAPEHNHSRYITYAPDCPACNPSDDDAPEPDDLAVARATRQAARRELRQQERATAREARKQSNASARAKIAKDKLLGREPFRQGLRRARRRSVEIAREAVCSNDRGESLPPRKETHAKG